MSTLCKRIDALEADSCAAARRLDSSVRIFRRALRQKARSPSVLGAVFGLGLAASRRKDWGMHVNVRGGVSLLAHIWTLGGMSLPGR